VALSVGIGGKDRKPVVASIQQDRGIGRQFGEIAIERGICRCFGERDQSRVKLMKDR
jgi:hypothetical protein